MQDTKSTAIIWALKVLPHSLRSKISSAIEPVSDKVQDIVLRCNRPVCVYSRGKQLYLTQTGCLTDSLKSQELVISTQQEVLECFNIACGYSVYSHISEIKEGFITIKGGHRVGIAGTAVMSSGAIHNIRDISTISIRISRQIIGCAEAVTQEYIRARGGLLICGSPCSGKTTLIRDMARLLSTLYAGRVALVDTRGELASVCQGVAQNDVGLCDVLDGYPRAEAIEQAVRSLSPEHIICDEIGSLQDATAIMRGINSGVRFVATIHAHNKQELIARENIRQILDTGAFKKVVFLSDRDKPCQITEQLSVEELCCV
ncbi:MAG: Flp pilus assembly complex ATPase component TadA [Ruminococcus sp.]|nr:Flp pilus assembly complex ATPase component TadA [Ruminococcus sp.]